MKHKSNIKNCALFTDCISEINKKELDHAKYTDVVMPIYLIWYSENYSKTSGSLWQYYKDEPFIDDNGAIIDVSGDPDKASFKYKQKSRKWWNKRYSNKVPLKHWSNFWRTIEMPFINCEINIFHLFWRLHYSNWYWWQSRTKICDNWYKTLYSSCNSVGLR